LLENAANVFGGVVWVDAPVDPVPLHAKISQQALELDFLNSALSVQGNDHATSLMPLPKALHHHAGGNCL
jgi:hypothetical protein